MIEMPNIELESRTLVVPTRRTRWCRADVTYYEQLLSRADEYLRQVAMNVELDPEDDQFMQDLAKLVGVSDDHVVMAILDRLIISSSKLGQWQELMYKAQKTQLYGQTFGYSTSLSGEPPRGKAICGDG